MDLKGKQKAVMQAMLNCDRKEEAWKVLIYDKFGEQIMAPLLNVAELRELGVTLNLLITNKREPVKDVPVVYFVAPTSENIDRICDDLKNELYSNCYLNFTSSLSRELLETLAKKTIETNSVHRISKVYDQYCSFTSIQDNFISLSMKHSYYKLNNPKQKDTELMAYIDNMVDSLFSVVVTMSVVPVIRARRGEAAEMIAQKLYKRLHDHLKSRKNLFARSDSALVFSRPMMIIVDRNMDLTVPLYHPWTYQALVHDIYNIKNAQVEIPVKDDNNDKVRYVKYELSDNDQFWKINSGQSFPRVLDAVQTSLAKYQDELKKIEEKRRNPRVGLDAGDMSEMAETINALPILQKQKKILDIHMLLASAVSDKVKDVELDAYFAIETDILGKNIFLDEITLLEQLGPDSKGTARDKLRLFIIHYLCCDKMANDLYDRSKNRLEETYNSNERYNNDDLYVLDCIKTHKLVNHINNNNATTIIDNQNNQNNDTSQHDSTLGIFSKLATKVYSQSSGLISGVRNLLPSKTELPLTSVIDGFLNQEDTKETKEYVYLDPKLSTSEHQYKVWQTDTTDAVVVMLGGGNYTEFQNLQDFATKDSQNKKNVTYITTEVLNPDEFIEQFILLGKQ